MKDVYVGFCEVVENLAAQTSPPVPVSYPGVGFTPPSAGIWLEVQWHPNRTVNYGMANEAPSLLRGFGRVLVCYRPGQGIPDGLEMAQRVVDAFAKGTILAGNVRVYRQPSIGPQLTDPERISHPVTVDWSGFDA
jgi:hypothetical protein